MDEPRYHLGSVVHAKSETLEDFDGPLDVILLLLSKNKIEIQNIQISRLVQIQFCGNKRPVRMIHPDSGNIVSISNKFSRFASNDSCISSIYSDTAIVVYYHTAYISWFHDKKSKTILPQISPASSAFAIIVMRQK